MTKRVNAANSSDYYGIDLIKNLLERIFMGIFITLFTNQMGDGNYYPILKVNSNSSQYGVTSPMADRRTDFNNMSEWLDSWRQKEFSWELLWEDFVKFVKVI